MTSSGEILFLFAHQDDEVFVAPRVAYERRRKAVVHIVYLTNGGAVRNNESLTVLRRLGVAEDHIHFLGGELQIPDGKLVEHLRECFDALVKKFHNAKFDEIYVPGWEGGHQDHDAVFLIGLAFARHLGLQDRLWQFYLYNGFRTFGRFFRVFCPLPNRATRRERKLSLTDGMLVLRAILNFKSQRGTWVGLLPQSLIHVLLERKEVFHLAEATQISGPAHQGALLYERYRRMSFADFVTTSESFRATCIDPPRGVGQ